MTLTVGSCFAGIGGLDLGLERAGMRVRWQIERDPYCLRVLAKHWPDVPRYGDIRDVRGDELERVDLIAGGFPCQDISSSGKRAGLAGERSGLFYELMRIVRVVGPRIVLLENVADLAARGLDAVLGELAECGFDAEWQTVSAAAVGLPQRRERVFIVAYAAGSGFAPGAFARLQCGSDAPQWDIGHGLATAQHRAAQAASLVCGMDDGLPKWMERVRALGNAVVPQVAELIGRRILDALT